MKPPNVTNSVSPHTYAFMATLRDWPGPAPGKE